jgi:hypothetical protein
MTARERLDNRRASVLFVFESLSMRFTCSYSCYPDGRIAELFSAALDDEIPFAPECRG